ncbi:MAG TPA: hypothetical protein VEV17_12040 [Bryobacteraceae bacterium]|nr:hypothetical protein [Bryobacteraceae bacterium]
MTTRTSNSAGSIGEVIGNGGRVWQRLAESKEALTDALDEKRRIVNRAWKRSREAAGDLVHETGRSIKRSPFRSVAIALGAGTLAGTLIGVLVSRNGRR